jgi:hypothetical protein
LFATSIPLVTFPDHTIVAPVNSAATVEVLANVLVDLSFIQISTGVLAAGVLTLFTYRPKAVTFPVVPISAAV